MTELRVESLAKRFGGLRVFQDLTFTLEAGGLLGVIGPNGAGKTTLINVISGRQQASAGRVILDNRDITNQPAYAVSRLGLGRSFQQTNTFKSVTVAENISRAIRFGGRGKPAGLDIMLDTFALTPRLHEIADKLPYGLQKMLGLVMAFATEPKVLMLDEPAAGLESTERQHVDTYVTQVRAAGTSVLIVEHDMDMIRRLCPRILVLDAGMLLADGSPAEVLARPDVIAAYLGDTEETE
jgi:ABC-type branched-subunit amino acid transport system ATPase component